MEDILYNGPFLIASFSGKTKIYKATSGMVDFQKAEFQSKKDAGPIPAGRYNLLLMEDKSQAKGNFTTCSLIPSQKLQRIPRGMDAVIPTTIQERLRRQGYSDTTCDTYWANWGANRIAVSPLTGTKTFGRAGFYIHDSQKFFTHGCIEVEPVFFDDLRLFMKSTKKKFLLLKVEYPSPETVTSWKAETLNP